MGEKSSVSLSQSLERLQKLREAPRAPEEEPLTMKRPSAKVTKRPASKEASNKAASKKAKEDGDKQSWSQKLAADKYKALRKKVPTALLKKHEFGCSRCRQAPFCTASCWKLRGYDAEYP